MSLEATHIRFAADLKDRYRVTNLAKYIPGAIYPDSRYPIGTDRRATHPEDYQNWDLEESEDFRKGWFMHLLCDKLCIDVAQDIFPWVFEGKAGQGNEVWINHTAMKILQDLDDLKKFDIKAYLPYLEHAETPNGESIEEMKKYHQIFIDMYADPGKTNIDSCYVMWEQLGIGEELAAKVKIQAEAFSKDRDIMDKIPLLYPAMLSRAV